jgi:membrane protease YdiL (CAAX protease family)
MIDYVLVVLLIGVMPARALYKDLRGKSNEVNRQKKYIGSGAIIIGLLALLSYAWLHGGRSTALLGLDIPLTNRGTIGLAIAIALLVGLVVVATIAKQKHRARNNDKGAERFSKNQLLPRTRHELSLFLAFALLAGCGWELLYRGFLIWFLVPYVGTIVAICIAALTYGAAHGYKSRKQFLASVISAFAFTVAFVLTGSLWWLMLIHTAAGFAGGIAGYKAASKHHEITMSSSEQAASP